MFGKLLNSPKADGLKGLKILAYVGNTDFRQGVRRLLGRGGAQLKLLWEYHFLI